MARMVRSESEGGHVDITERDKSSLVSAEYNIRKNHEFLIEDRVVRMHLVDEPHMGIQQEMRRGQQEEETKYDAIYVTEQPDEDATYSWELVLCRQLTENGTLIVPNFQIAKEPESSDDDVVPLMEEVVPNLKRPKNLRERWTGDKEQRQRQRRDWMRDKPLFGKTAEDMEEIFKSSEDSPVRETTDGVNNTISYVKWHEKRLKDWHQKIDEENVHKRVKHARKMRQKERKERRKAREAKKKPYSNRGDPLENYAYFIEYTPANRSSTDTATLSFGGAVNKIRREITWMELHQQDSK